MYSKVAKSAAVRAMVAPASVVERPCSSRIAAGRVRRPPKEIASVVRRTRASVSWKSPSSSTPIASAAVAASDVIVKNTSRCLTDI